MPIFQNSSSFTWTAKTKWLTGNDFTNGITNDWRASYYPQTLSSHHTNDQMSYPSFWHAKGDQNFTMSNNTNFRKFIKTLDFLRETEATSLSDGKLGLSFNEL